MKNTSIRRAVAALLFLGAAILKAQSGVSDESYDRFSIDNLLTPAPRNDGFSSDAPAAADGTEALGARLRVAEAYGKLPLRFEANQGQTDSRVSFIARGLDYALFLTPVESVFVLSPRNGKQASPKSATTVTADATSGRPPEVLRMELLGANAKAEVAGTDELGGRVSYFIGNDPNRWHTNVPTFQRVRYHEAYPGIDLVYYGNQRQLEYDFVVAPGADLRQIALRFGGASKVEIEQATGDLVLSMGTGTIRHHAPQVYQEVSGARKMIAGKYVKRANERVGFEVAKYDRTLPLVIDPSFVYSTYFGGNANDSANAIAVDSSGNAYVTGQTSSTNFPLAHQVQTAYGGNQDAFVTKLNASGTAIVYSTYLGGSGQDTATGIAVDSGGNAYVVGWTSSTNFPSAGTSRPYAGSQDAFVTKINSTGTGLVYSTCLGGNDQDTGTGIAVDSNANAYVTGFTQSVNFPVVNPYQGAFGGTTDAFVTKMSPSGTILYSTFLGGSTNDQGAGIAVDSSGNAYVIGETDSVNFPTHTPIQGTLKSAGFSDVFVTKLNPMGTAIVYSTYLGGTDDDSGIGIAVDSSGNAYITGSTDSTNFPTSSPIQGTFGGGSVSDAFVAKISAAGTELVYSTYLGGNGNDSGSGIGVDSVGNAYVTGQTTSTNFPTVNPIQGTYGGGISDAFVTRINPQGAAFVYSTYLGGSDIDTAYGIAVDPQGNAYVAGLTYSTNFPVATPIQSTKSTFGDAFITMIGAVTSAPPAINISTRLGVLTGDKVLIGGIIIHGSQPTTILFRALGPTLAQPPFNVPGAMADPTMELHTTDNVGHDVIVATNDNWKESQQNAIVATGKAPPNDSESAILQTLAPGNYTVIVSGKNNTTGVALVEAYDIAQGTNAMLFNISTRGFVGTGNNVMIAGYIVGSTSKFIVRALGPTLTQFGVSGVLADPVLGVFDANGNPIASNDNWQSTQAAEIEASGYAPPNAAEPAIILTRPPGNTTAIVSGKNGTTGVALAEVYYLP